jgi:dihydropteroate synthase
VPEQLALARVLPVVRAVRAELDVPLSIDTYKASVAAAALDAGADMVNDVWALQRDPRLAAVVAERGVPVVLMDNCSNAAALRHDRRLGGHYAADEEADVVADVTGRIRALVENARLEGISPSRILVDPGIGFGKSRSQNLALLDGLEELGRLGYPVLVGPSRKSFIGLTLDAPPEDRVEGTAAAVAIAIARGADIVRVHDVTAMCRVARMTDAIVRRGGAETSGEAGGTITAR